MNEGGPFLLEKFQIIFYKHSWQGFSQFSILQVNIGHRPLLVDEGGALTLCLYMKEVLGHDKLQVCLTVLSFFYCAIRLNEAVRV